MLWVLIKIQIPYYYKNIISILNYNNTNNLLISLAQLKFRKRYTSSNVFTNQFIYSGRAGKFDFCLIKIHN